jgi:hypothetical protein
MSDLATIVTAVTPRRGFFTRMAGAAALGMTGLAPSAAGAKTTPANGPNWPGKLAGRHRQVVDAYEINSGFPLAFAYNFLAPNQSATAVIILRHAAFPLALEHAMWEKYKIGETFNIVDPETKAPAVKNPYLRPKPGVLLVDAMAIDKLLAGGSVFGACDVALHVLSARLAANAGVSADAAAKEWAANVIQGVTVIPSGVWGVNRAQEAGCTYCAGG